MEVDRACTTQVPESYHQSSRSMEARGTQETRTPKDYLEEDSRGRGSYHGTVMGHLEDSGSGPREMEELCCCPSCPWQEG
ncbi:hypothetical protein ElyMa_004254700 [Elysia marginata]|uniref:Uncharacterized protein n=1 Tax=Elysia marginata TaxID=1093978 RepID=A0AAV4GRX6_9GAST|nr:hypothetical protein ElyMa_004254700 [Elysia marginata]